MSFLPTQRPQPSPSALNSGSPQASYPATSNPVFSSNPGYQAFTFQEQEAREPNPFQNPEESGEPICFCLHPVTIRAVLNVASLVRAGASSIIEYASVGANWAPPAPADSDIESDLGDEGDLEELRRRRGTRKWNGPPQPVFVPAGGFTSTSWGREEQWSRQDEGRDAHDVGRDGRGKRWKGKGKAVDMMGGLNGYSRSDPGGRGKLRGGAYVPAEPDRRGTTWYPKGADRTSSKE
ncbi:hypothetical protein B0T20DRAFT_394747 [Sordaria brevicollis]|uniref:Uncharacterized protein n=1 Tax=Sordaria brevicollis TaxID=83679 RepID=A0AAE0U9S2_SORBR|nr:hypothetical protein B0T20DRAFT_394747 [Sordaria brevicollis]